MKQNVSIRKTFLLNDKYLTHCFRMGYISYYFKHLLIFLQTLRTQCQFEAVLVAISEHTVP